MARNSIRLVDAVRVAVFRRCKELPDGCRYQLDWLLRWSQHDQRNTDYNKDSRSEQFSACD